MTCLLVPCGTDGTSGGVLICSENYITFKNFGDQKDIRCPIPRRKVWIYIFDFQDSKTDKVQIISWSTITFWITYP